jgi:hypothetical protein
MPGNALAPTASVTRYLERIEFIMSLPRGLHIAVERLFALE